MFGVEGTSEDKHSAVTFARFSFRPSQSSAGDSVNRDRYCFTVPDVQRQKTTGRLTFKAHISHKIP